MKCNLVQSQLTRAKKLLGHIFNEEGELIDILGELHEVAILTAEDSVWLGGIHTSLTIGHHHR
jgi:hypothetical protein